MTDTALYIGPAARLLDSTDLVPNVTITAVHFDEAALSDLWDPGQPFGGSSKPLGIWDGGPPPVQVRVVLDGGTP